MGGRSFPIGRGRLVVVSVGKAAAAMARAAEKALGSRIDDALAVANAPAARPLRTRLLVAGHPLPDERGLTAARAVESLVRPLATGDTLVVLLSGGASALLPAPVRLDADVELPGDYPDSESATRRGDPDELRGSDPADAGRRC